jgi:hypothetical protein
MDAVLAVALERDLTLIVDYHNGGWHVSLQTFDAGAFTLRGSGKTLIEALGPVAAHLRAAGYDVDGETP